MLFSALGPRIEIKIELNVARNPKIVDVLPEKQRGFVIRYQDENISSVVNFGISALLEQFGQACTLCCDYCHVLDGGDKWRDK